MTPEEMPLTSEHDLEQVLQRALWRHRGGRYMLLNMLTDVIG